ncbi:hypothetical protein FHU41_002558 [Psychromicrobium silvestre]|uniref:Uncharacterized protein n=1 Tax=Psychromicrobium silvestre TaxID=1645614 RepID=A0A7Y9LVD7_9MICC|nr:hypothetical protein [Psychromicrobium silvestre]NYE96308.1 hypothetical protein [Psychromicrobium silvestre]
MIYSITRRKALLIPAIFSVLLVSGCQQNNAGSPSSEPPLEKAQSISEVSQISRPIDAYLPTASEVLSLARLQIRTTNSCYAKNGLPQEYAKNVSDSKLLDFIKFGIRNRSVRSDLWGFFDPAQPAKDGYRYPSDFKGLELTKGNVPDEVFKSCDDEAKKSVSSNLGFLGYLGQEILPNGGPLIPLQDTRFASIAGQWSSCMTSEGLSYATPISAVSDLKWRSGTVPSKEEIAVAAADKKCKSNVNLVGSALAVQAAYDKAYIAQYKAQLDGFKTQLANLVKAS